MLCACSGSGDDDDDAAAADDDDEKWVRLGWVQTGRLKVLVGLWIEVVEVMCAICEKLSNMNL